ncbi:hypothetical protein C2857_001299 [Epichloe festucae Fl1]|uniref:Uncharacterized protein n=1 Tax=Epichloe festucae (strain Fl1) TaxID=877507 RepID=A0A7S9PV37_EPIFF|nr:hypothetical protein C2857_001299 [Epichloe festucae Fl1]
MTTPCNPHGIESPGHLASTTTHHSREQRLRGKLHEGWETICIGTALCDFCGKQSRGVVQKCLKCGLSICCQCSQSGALRENRNHRLDHDAVSWDKNVVAGLKRAVRRADTRLKGSQDDHVAPVSGNGEVAPVIHGHVETSPWFSVQGGWRCEKATQTPWSWCPDGHIRASLDGIIDGGAHCPDEEDAAHILAGMPTSAAVFCNKKPLDLGLQDDPGTASAWEGQGPRIPRHGPGYYTNDHHTYETLGKWEGNSPGNHAQQTKHDHDGTNPQHQYHHLHHSKKTHSAQLFPRKAHPQALGNSAASHSLGQTTHMSRKRNAPPGPKNKNERKRQNTAKNGWLIPPKQQSTRSSACVRNTPGGQVDELSRTSRGERARAKCTTGPVAIWTEDMYDISMNAAFIKAAVEEGVENTARKST